MRLDGGEEINIERRDKIVVEPLLARLRECLPRQVIDIPCVVERDVGKSERDGTAGLGEEGDEEVGAEGDGSSDRSLQKNLLVNKIK